MSLFVFLVLHVINLIIRVDNVSGLSQTFGFPLHFNEEQETKHHL